MKDGRASPAARSGAGGRLVGLIAAGLVLGVAFPSVGPATTLAQRVDDAALAELVGCYALEVGEWTVDWDPGRLPSRLELLEDLRPAPDARRIAEATGGPPPEPARSARATDEEGALVPGFDRWTPMTPTSFVLPGSAFARVDLRFMRRDGDGYRGFAIPNRPGMDPARAGRLPRAPILARPLPCDP